MMTQPQLDQLKSDLRRQVAEGIGEALRSLQEQLPSHCRKQDEVLALRSRLNEVNRQKIQGVLSQEDLQLAYNQLRADLIALIRGLTLEDFAPALSADKLRDKKTGQILYKIPGHMQVEAETRCLVRLAFEAESLIRDIELTEDVTVKSVRIAEVMNVCLLDPNDEPAFRIRPFSSEEQFVERGDYTEWVFYVTPLREGAYPLLLKVSVIEVVQGKERRKDIVLEETIRITAAAAERTEPEFKASRYQLNAAGAEAGQWEDFIPEESHVSPRILTPKKSDTSSQETQSPPLAPSTPPGDSRRRSLRRTLSIAAGFLIIVTAALFLFELPGSSSTVPTDQQEEPASPEEDPAEKPDTIPAGGEEDTLR